jgi:hypothetical protein
MMSPSRLYSLIRRGLISSASSCSSRRSRSTWEGGQQTIMSAMQPDTTVTLAHRDLLAGRYLAARARLLAAGDGHREDLWNLWFWTLLSIDPWAEGWPVAAGEPQAPADSLANAEPDGLAVVEQLAAEATAAGRVVILMERHALPESRWAGVRLIPVLRRAGATHLVFECSDQERLDRAVREGVVRRDSAPYTYEPSRAALLRAAMRAGLTLTAFDYPKDPDVLRAVLDRPMIPGLSGLRERWMAENLHALIAAEPDARIVVWTGGQHAWKRMPEYFSVPLFSSWAEDRTMAMVLTEIADGEPWCLGQALVHGPERQPGAVRANHPWAAAHGLDAVLVHFRGAHRRCPSWIGDSRRSVKLSASGARLVQAFAESEGPDAVPADQAIARNAEVTLMLTPDRYLCRGVDDSERLVWQQPWTSASDSGQGEHVGGRALAAPLLEPTRGRGAC